MRPYGRLLGLALLLSLPILAGSCIGSEPISNLTFTCAANSDCASTYTCQLGRCVHPCQGAACDTWITALSGTLTTAGGTTYTAGSIRVTQDGFERQERACNGTVCVSGGLTP